MADVKKIEELSDQELDILANAVQTSEWSKVPDYLMDAYLTNVDTTQNRIETKPERLKATATGAGELLSAGYAPQIAGAVGELTGNDYVSSRDEYSDFQRKMQKENPTEYLGGQILGGVGQMLAPMGAAKVASKIPGVSKVADYAGKIASKFPSAEGFKASAAKSTAIGAVAGALQNTPDVPGEITYPIEGSDLKNRFTNTAVGAGFGLGTNMLGAGANALFGGVDRGWQSLGPNARYGKMTAEAESANVRRQARDRIMANKQKYYSERKGSLPSDEADFADLPSDQAPQGFSADGQGMPIANRNNQPAQRSSAGDDFSQTEQGNFSNDPKRITRTRDLEESFENETMNWGDQMREVGGGDIVPLYNEKALKNQFQKNFDITMQSEGIKIPKSNAEREALPHIDINFYERNTKGYDGRLMTKENIVDYAQRKGILQPGTTKIVNKRAQNNVEEVGIELQEAYIEAQNEAYKILTKNGVTQDKVDLILNTKGPEKIFVDIASSLNKKFKVSINKEPTIRKIEEFIFENAPDGAASIIKLNKLKQVLAAEADFVKTVDSMTNQEEVYKYASQLVDKEIKERLYVLDQITGKNYSKKIGVLNKDYSLGSVVADMSKDQLASFNAKKEGFVNKLTHLLPTTLINTTAYSALSPVGRSGLGGAAGKAAGMVNSQRQSFEGYPMNMLADVETDDQRKAYEQSIQNSGLPPSEKARRMVLLQKGKVFLGK